MNNMKYVIEISGGVLVDFRIEKDDGSIERPIYELIDHDNEDDDDCKGQHKLCKECEFMKGEKII
jgi:hypothetical protein